MIASAITVYIIVCMIFGVWAIHRQMQRWSGNSVGRLISVFLINTIGFPICLVITIVNKNLVKTEGEIQTPIEDYGK